MNITPYLYVPFAAWAIAQLIKFSLAFIKGDVNVRYLYASGGMPSVHSAVVCSLATWALIDGGLASPLFGFTAVFAGIVMYDSFGVRRSAGENAKTLNRLITDLSINGSLRNAAEYTRMREILGHQPLEVIIGAILGIFIALAFGYQKIVDKFPAVFSMVSPVQAKIILIVGAVALITAPFIYLYGVRKHSKQPKLQSSFTYIALINLVAGLALVLASFLVYEDINSIFNQWLFVGPVIGVWVVAGGYFKVRILGLSKKAKVSQKELSKSAWLKKAKSKKTKKKSKK